MTGLENKTKGCPCFDICLRDDSRVDYQSQCIGDGYKECTGYKVASGEIQINLSPIGNSGNLYIVDSIKGI